MSLGSVGATPGHAAFPWGRPGSTGVCQGLAHLSGDAEVPRGCGQSRAGSRPRCRRQEAEVWGRRGVSILRALPGDSDPPSRLSDPEIQDNSDDDGSKADREGSPEGRRVLGCWQHAGTVTGTMLPRAVPRQGRREHGKDTASAGVPSSVCGQG